MKKIGIILAILSVLTLSFITNNNVSAASDITYTINSSLSNEQSYTIYNGTSPYHYLMIDTSSIVFDNVQQLSFSYTFNGNSSSSVLVPNNQLGSVLVIGSPSFQITRLIYNSNYNISHISSGSITITLSENNPAGGITPEGSLDVSSNGIYDVTNYASVNVNVDSSLPPFVDIVIDAFWKYHVAFAAAIPAILAIFFIFRFIKGRVK